MLKAMTSTQAQNPTQIYSGGSTFNLTTPPAGSRGCVLVIESEKLIRNWLHWVLHSRGYEVVTAATAEEAEHRLYHVGANQFGLVIADVNLKHVPNRVPLAGYQLYQTWKRSFPAMPFLLMSDAPRDRQLADVKEGAVALLVKRFVIAQLMEAVRLLYRQQTPIHDTAIKVALSA
jgi:DNA-binding response OmpR family regulator